MGEKLDFIKHKKLLDKIINGDVILLTGAGFSMGATTKGKPMLSSNSLIEKILKDILEETTENIERIKKRKNFQQICQLAINTITENEFNNFLERVFKNTVPDEFHYLFLEINWKELYTLNIDDLIERMYEDRYQIYGIEIQSYNTNKQPQEYVGNKILKYYKLHGDVNNKSEGFVFSSTQYLTKLTQKNRTYNFTKFAERLYHDTFCFLGTSLNEVDLEVYVEEYGKGIGSSLPKEKIYYINRTIYPEDEIELERKNIICIEETAETFINKILEYKQKNSNNFGQLKIKKKLDLNIRLSNLGFNIEKDLNVSFDSVSLSNHKPIQFYTGYEVKWIDIISQSDAILKNTEQLINDIGENNHFNLFLLLGKSGNGKTTSLKRLIYHYSTNNDYIVLDYNNSTQLSNEMAKYLAKELNKIHKKIIITFDNASWAFNFIKSCYSFLHDTVSLSVVLTSRVPEYYREMRNLDNIPKYIYNFDETICRENAKRLIEKLEEKSYLGHLAEDTLIDKRITKFLQAYHNNKNNKDLFSVLISSTEGTGYFKKIDEKLQSIMSKKQNAHFLIVLAIFDSFASYALPLQLYFNIFKSDIIDLKTTILECSDLLNNNDLTNYDNLNINIRPRGSFITKHVLKSYNKHFSQEDILEITKKIVIYFSKNYDVSSNINRNKNKTIYSEMTHSLFIAKYYVQKFNIKEKKIFDNYYHSLNSYFQENSDFWLQYAKMEMKLKDFESSKIHLEQALALNPNSLHIQHAQGQWCMFKASYIKDYSEAKIIFKDGENLMRNLLLIRNDAYSVHSYIDGFLMFHKKFGFELEIKKIQYLYKLILTSLKEFNNHSLLLIIWKKFYLFLENNNKTSYITISLDELKQMDEIDINRSAEDQYII